ncbi:MAG: hypothetical protein K2O69_01075, partial [Odoribacter sp.]|nr:hypothetical protein [Odoribacter sp.]
SNYYIIQGRGLSTSPFCFLWGSGTAIQGFCLFTRVSEGSFFRFGTELIRKRYEGDTAENKPNGSGSAEGL